MNRFVLLIFLATLLGQNITHEFEDSIHPNAPLNIEAEIISPLKAINRVSLFYRTPNQENYFQLDLISFQKDFFSGSIPISVLDGDYIEYLIVAELEEGGAVSLPSISPFENPIKVKIIQIEQQGGSQVTNQSGNLKSNALILSPLENSRVNLDDILIALSLFNVKNLDKSAVIVLFDDEDVSSDVLVEEGLLTYIPNDILPGLHEVSINMKNNFGLNFETIKWSFNIISSFAESKVSSFKKGGKISSEMYESSVDQNIVQFNTYNFDFTGSWDWMKIRSKIKISSLESEYQQSRNRISIGFTTPFMKVGFGDLNPVFNQYILNGTRIRGIDLKLKSKFFQLEYIQGELARAIQGDPLDDAMVISSVSHPIGEIIINDNGNGVWDDAEDEVDESYPEADFDPDEIKWFIDTNGNGVWDDAEDFIDCNSDLTICEGDDAWEASYGNGVWDALVLDGDIGIGRDNYTFKNEVMGANIGFGNGDNFHMNINFLKARDNVTTVVPRIEGSIVHLTNELDTIVSNSGLQYFEIDTTERVTETGIEILYDFSIPYKDLINNCGEIFGPNYDCQVLYKDWSGVLPQDNLVIGSDFLWVFDDRHMSLESGFSFSLLNQNIWDPVMTKDELDTLAVIGDDSLDSKIGGVMNIPIDPEDFEDTFIMNLNQIPLLPIDVSEGKVGLKQILHMPSLAYNLNLKMNYGNHNIGLGYRQVGPDYFSLANPNIQKNIREKTISDRAKFFNNRMFVIFKYQNTDDGISLLTETISTTKKMDININLYPGVGLPTFSLGIGVNTRDNGIAAEFDTIFVGVESNIDTLLIESSNRDYTKTTRTNILISDAFKYGGIHGISLNITQSEKIDLMEVSRGSAILEGDYYSPASTSESFSLNLQSTFKGNIETNLSVSSNYFTFSKGKYFQTQALSFLDFMINRNNTKYFDGIKFGGNLTFGQGAANFDQSTFRAGFEKKFYDVIILRTNFEYRRKTITSPEITKYNNYQITANIGYTF